MENVKNVMTGAYFKDKESIGFDFVTDFTIVEKANFVNSVVESLDDGVNYNFILKEMIFDFMLVRMMTNIAFDNPSLEVIEQFLNETDVVNVIKANAKDGLIEELNKSVDKSIAYRTGVHINPLGEALASLVNTLEKKINQVDLDSMMEMATKFAGMTEELNVDNIVNAYMNSDTHKKNLDDIDEVKKQRELMAKSVSNIVDIAVDKAKEDMKKGKTRKTK